VIIVSSLEQRVMRPRLLLAWWDLCGLEQLLANNNSRVAAVVVPEVEGAGSGVGWDGGL
jgi:hypothetical protein